VFFVSVASKGFSFPVSSLESTLTGILVSVADKGVSGEWLVASGEFQYGKNAPTPRQFL
jgi:hypothetical protein